MARKIARVFATEMVKSRPKFKVGLLAAGPYEVVARTAQRAGKAAPPLRMNAVKTDESRQIDLKEAESCYLHGQKGAEGWFGGESDECRKTSARSHAHMA
jgi:hypothetical protein